MTHVPRNLDALILAAEAKEAEAQRYGAFQWFRGERVGGDVETFRFARGGTLANFHNALVERQLVRVRGPFKTRTAAAEGA